MTFEIEQIGTIHSPYKDKEDCPIQGIIKPEGRGKVEIFPEYEEGLDDNPHGVFASRHPSRPNRIGISIVKLEKREGNVLVVSELDVLDNTPLVDIKPYIPRFDNRREASNGWIENLKLRDKPEGVE